MFEKKKVIFSIETYAGDIEKYFAKNPLILNHTNLCNN